MKRIAAYLDWLAAIMGSRHHLQYLRRISFYDNPKPVLYYYTANGQTSYRLTRDGKMYVDIATRADDIWSLYEYTTPAPETLDEIYETLVEYHRSIK